MHASIHPSMHALTVDCVHPCINRRLLSLPQRPLTRRMRRPTKLPWQTPNSTQHKSSLDFCFDSPSRSRADPSLLRCTPLQLLQAWKCSFRVTHSSSNAFISNLIIIISSSSSLFLTPTSAGNVPTYRLSAGTHTHIHTHTHTHTHTHAPLFRFSSQGTNPCSMLICVQSHICGHPSSSFKHPQFSGSTCIRANAEWRLLPEGVSAIGVIHHQVLGHPCVVPHRSMHNP
jgi:hypothetical protein